MPSGMEDGEPTSVHSDDHIQLLLYLQLRIGEAGCSHDHHDHSICSLCDSVWSFRRTTKKLPYRVSTGFEESTGKERHLIDG